MLHLIVFEYDAFAGIPHLASLDPSFFA